MKSKKNYIIAVFTILFCALFYILFFPIKFKINTERKALFLPKVNEETVLETTIKIVGDYYFYVLKDDRFQGKLIIEGFDQTMEEEANLTFHQGMSVLLYQKWMNSELHSNAIGIISSDISMRHIMLLLNDENNSINFGNDQVCFLMSPAADRSEMIKSYQEMKRRVQNWSE